MINRTIQKILPNSNSPRSLIFVLDILWVLFSLLLAYWLRFNLNIPDYEIPFLVRSIPWVLGVRIIFMILFKTHQGIIRYTEVDDALRILYSSFLGSFALLALNYLSFKLNNYYILPTSIVFIEFFITTISLIFFRFFVKYLYQRGYTDNKSERRVVIFGAGERGRATQKVLAQSLGLNYITVAFVDDSSNKIGKSIDGIKIESTKKLSKVLSNNVDQLIIASHNVKRSRINELLDICLSFDVDLTEVPSPEKWVKGEFNSSQIKKVKIEDLLGRDEIKLDLANISDYIDNKIILVTGAAGSIGSEIARQLCKFNFKKIYLLDIAESPLYEIDLELKKFQKDIEVVIADIRSKERLENVFNTFKPQIIFHAAAYKHVPLVENNPSEGVNTNVLGSKNLADLSHEHQIEKFVMISTDKAVNPTNVMGASKRAAEMYVQSLDKHSKTKFITTRFGNVLGSNGSVIPLFRKQIEKGGPLTVTHPEITRFFMTIPEACQLVLEAGAMGEGGEVYVFDMGESVKIVDLARRMIRLSGLEEGVDIEISFTGLRPGEKLYEELLNDEENTIPTHHNKILIGKVIEYSYENVDLKVENLRDLFKIQDNFEIVKLLKDLVPEFKSKNSVYQKLDLDE